MVRGKPGPFLPAPYELLPYLVHPLLTSESSSFLLFPGKRMVQPQRGLIPSILPTHWDRATLPFPSYHLLPTILSTFP